MSNSPRKVLVIQRRMTHYRIPFFEALKREMALRNCELIVAYGNGADEEKVKNDSAELPWGKHLKTFYAFSGKLCWQPYSAYLSGVDMVVITHENKLIYNLVSQFFHRRYRIGLWGHGANLQGDPSSLRERFKRLMAKRADWWFGYTEFSRPFIEQTGFSKDRITILNNSVDTSDLADMCKKVQPEELNKLKQEFAINGTHVGIYVGSMYEEKRIEFMLEAAVKIHDALPSFEFLILGSGPQQFLVEEFCANNSWVKYLGVRKGQSKVNVMALAKVMINPGLVGLGILDSFVCGVPMVTTDCGLHSPEIAYLQDGENGLMTDNSMSHYVSSVVNLLQDEVAFNKLKSGCLESAQKYTIENMARNFADGVMQCLEAPGYLGSNSF